MSLINDALKRAHQTQRKQPVAGPLGVPLQPAEAPRKPLLGPALFLGASLLLVVALAGGMIALGMRLFQTPPPPGQQAASAQPQPVAVASRTAIQPRPSQSSRASHTSQPDAGPEPQPTRAAPVAAPASAPTGAPEAQPAALPVAELARPSAKPVANETPAVAAAAAMPKPVENAGAGQTAAGAAAPAADPAPGAARPEFPKLTLRGIFYSPTRPSALINGKPVFVGNVVSGARVVTIERDSVTVEFEGERRVMALE